MKIHRRDFVVAALAAGASGPVPVQGDVPAEVGKPMYGLIGKITAVEGKRDALIAILIEGTREMPGCLSYIVAKDPADEAAIWVTEAWDGPESHKASLALPAVRTAMTKGKPMIAKFETIAATEPAGGHGLAPSKSR